MAELTESYQVVRVFIALTWLLFLAMFSYPVVVYVMSVQVMRYPTDTAGVIISIQDMSVARKSFVGGFHALCKKARFASSPGSSCFCFLRVYKWFSAILAKAVFFPVVLKLVSARLRFVIPGSLLVIAQLTNWTAFYRRRFSASITKTKCAHSQTPLLGLGNPFGIGLLGKALGLGDFSFLFRPFTLVGSSVFFRHGVSPLQEKHYTPEVITSKGFFCAV